MCGRYRISRADLLEAAFKARPGPGFEEFSETHLKHNFRPTNQVPIIRLRDGRERVLDVAGWGFIPSWTKAKPKIQPFNARSEGVATSGMFRGSFDKRRCLMPAEFFFEPKGKEKKRQAYAFRRPDQQPFALAGIWDPWHAEGRKTADTCTMLTTVPNTLMKPIHDRMPVVVLEHNWNRWMDPKMPGGEVIDLLQPAPDDFLETWPVFDMDGDPETNGGYRSDIPEDQR